MKGHISILFIFVFQTVFGQVNDQLAQSWAPAAGFATADNYAVSWSVGDALVFSGTDGEYAVTQGFGQPMICNTNANVIATNTIDCSKPYTLKVSPGFSYYRWKLDTSFIGNAKDSIYLPSTQGKYTAIMGDSSGCYITTEPFEVDFSLKKGITTITVLEEKGRDTLLVATESASYQWFVIIPEDGISRAISNANKQSFRPYYNGTYFVKTHTEDQCVSYSSQYRVDNAGQEEISRALYSITDSSILFKYTRSQNYRLQLYPNPCAGTFTIDYESPVEKQLIISVYNTLGQFIERREMVKSVPRLKEEYLTGWRSGIYIIKIDDGSRVIYENLIVQ